jgi:F-box-like
MLQRVTIRSLPDDVLLEIFDIHLNPHYRRILDPWMWQKLAHVCRRWRCIVFASPLRLNLELHCTYTTPVRKLLHIWPEFPLFIDLTGVARRHTISRDVLDHVTAALEHRDRVRSIMLWDLTSSHFERITTMMKEPFPALTKISLVLLSSRYRVLHIPDTFLNGSAPSLRDLHLKRISFPSLPRLLSSASHLTRLELWEIQPENWGDIPPQSMATCLSSTKLEALSIGFARVTHTPDPRRRARLPPPPTRIVLPALTALRFQGVGEYLEDFVSQIDAPLLRDVLITFSNQFIFDIPQISRLILRQVSSMPHNLILEFGPNCACIRFYSQQKRSLQVFPDYYESRIMCTATVLDWQVDSIAQMRTHFLPLCSSVNSLHVRLSSHDTLRIQLDDLDPTQWVELFSSFTSLQTLRIPRELERFIAAALQGLTEESAAEVLPALRSLSIYGTTADSAVEQGIQSFVAARQHSDHPVTLSRSPPPRWPLF